MKLFLYILSAVFILTSQAVIAEETKSPDTTIFQETSLLAGSSLVTDSTNFEKHLIQNPTKALFKSMLVPGWGQYGNKKKIKALLFASFDIWMISKALNHKKKANDLWNLYESSDDIDTRNYYHSLYDSERNRRNKYTWYAVITSFFAMFDAYVDAHLSGFPKEKDKKLSIDIVPSESSGAVVSLSFHF